MCTSRKVPPLVYDAIQGLAVVANPTPMRPPHGAYRLCYAALLRPQSGAGLPPHAHEHWERRWKR